MYTHTHTNIQEQQKKQTNQIVSDSFQGVHKKLDINIYNHIGRRKPRKFHLPVGDEFLQDLR